MQNNHIPVYQPALVGNEKDYVNDCLETNWISSRGKYIERFEKEFAKYIGVAHATSVCNGTVALHLALKSIGIGKGDEVILPSLAYVAAANAISHVGATPVFADVDPNHWNMNLMQARDLITVRTKAIMAVHLYGQLCDMIELRSICDEQNIFLIEDSAEAFGSKFGDQFAGAFGDIATFSFFGNKTITTGEGGMVVTNNETLVRRAKLDCRTHH